MEYASVSLLPVSVEAAENNSPPSPDLSENKAVAPETLAFSSAYYDLVSSSSSPYQPVDHQSPQQSPRIEFTPISRSPGGGLDEFSSSTTKLTPECENPQRGKHHHHHQGHCQDRKHSAVSATSSGDSGSSFSHKDSDTNLEKAEATATFSSPQSTRQLRRTALLVTLASFIIGTGCFPLSLAALILVCRKGGRADYKNALIIATMGSVVGLAVSGLVITYIVLRLERQALQGV